MRKICRRPGCGQAVAPSHFNRWKRYCCRICQIKDNCRRQGQKTCMGKLHGGAARVVPPPGMDPTREERILYYQERASRELPLFSPRKYG